MEFEKSGNCAEKQEGGRRRGGGKRAQPPGQDAVATGEGAAVLEGDAGDAPVAVRVPPCEGDHLAAEKEPHACRLQVLPWAHPHPAGTRATGGMPVVCEPPWVKKFAGK